MALSACSEELWCEARLDLYAGDSAECRLLAHLNAGIAERHQYS